MAGTGTAEGEVVMAAVAMVDVAVEVTEAVTMKRVRKGTMKGRFSSHRFPTSPLE